MLRKTFFFVLLHNVTKLSEKKKKKPFISFRFKAKRKNWKRNKRQIIGSETKRKNAILISLCLEAKNLK
jgi:hypothetical protein